MSQKQLAERDTKNSLVPHNSKAASKGNETTTGKKEDQKKKTVFLSRLPVKVLHNKIIMTNEKGPPDEKMKTYDGPSGSGSGGNNRRNDTNVLEENTQTLQDLVKLLTDAPMKLTKKMMRK